MIFEGFSTENKRLVQNITTSAQTLNKDIFESHSQRLASRGGHFTADQLIPVYFAALMGVPTERNDRSKFNNMLFQLREDLIKSPKLLLKLHFFLNEKQLLKNLSILLLLVRHHLFCHH